MKSTTKRSFTKKEDQLPGEHESRLVKFVAKISKIPEFEKSEQVNRTSIHDAYEKKRVTRSKSPHTSLSPARLSPLTTGRQLQADAKYSIFTTKTPSNLVLVSETPISGRLISTTLQSTQDVSYFSSTLQNKPHSFVFDAVLDECAAQEKFYNQNVRQLIKGLMVGRSSSVICFGPAE